MSVAMDVDGGADGEGAGNRLGVGGNRAAGSRAAGIRTAGGPALTVRPARPPRAPRRAARRYGTSRRPGGRPLSYGPAGTGVSRAAHTRFGGDTGWGTVVVVALATALAIVAFGALAQWQSGDAVPDRTGVVQVRAGESLGEVAERSAPGVPVERAVERIVELNALDGTGVHPGQALIVPVSAG
ncbi:LysM peptidoglycan-binding domain-containing protein [Rhodococcus sp. NPDC058532]|uniref:LysM peptidoglycan-binding domain-containing protein n=1 Tax=Rhodococcus sp. NPDC058532 TaxID=3346540 RepID=UPI00365D6A88